MLTSKLLPLRQVAVGILASDATALFHVIAASVVRSRGGPRVDQISSRLAQRHARRSVALGHGIALPRAAVPGLACRTAAFVRLSRPLPMDAPDGEPVVDVLCLLVPPPGFSDDWDLLASLGDRLVDPTLRTALRQARSVEHIHQLLTAGTR